MEGAYRIAGEGLLNSYHNIHCLANIKFEIQSKLYLPTLLSNCTLSIYSNTLYKISNYPTSKFIAISQVFEAVWYLHADAP